MDAKIILGFVGQIASGKGTVSKYLKEKYQAKLLRFSDPLRETLNLYDLETSRDNMQKISLVLRENFGDNLLAKAIAKKAKEAETELVAIDGVRRFTDVENLVALPNFNLVAIAVDQRLRYKRYIERNENPGDDKFSFEEFCQKDTAEAESRIPEVMQKSKFTVDNNGSLEDLHVQLDNIIKQLK